METEMQEQKSLERKHWRWTFGASLANYIDSGSIVAGGAALAVWQGHFNLSDLAVGVLSAFSSNAISAGIGALIGGWLCDKVGRKKIYEYDLLCYIVGIIILVSAPSSWVLILGYIIMGLSVGADIPASWTIIAENAQTKNRSRHGGVAQSLWAVGVMVTLAIAFFTASLQMWGVRIVFLHLALVAFATWLMRVDMPESKTWFEERQRIKEGLVTNVNKVKLSSLFKGKNLKALIFLIVLFGIWNFAAGTNGFFLPYLLKNFGNQTQATSLVFQLAEYAVTFLACTFIFMNFADNPKARRWLFLSGSGLCVLAMSLFAFFPLNTGIAILFILFWGYGNGCGEQQFYQIWASELFPTRFRATAQGFMWAVIRISLGFWSMFVPILATIGFHLLGLLMTIFTLISMVVGLVFMPNTGGKSLKKIEEEQGQAL
ncbi:MFS transporter [Sporolactobacillus sp. KGMB 08714]|uniref:MFS transporter n=1 Tax=Sporolactobacillus sp. KGMB 08714 TaxID=3064704 RepID=UPI002FBF0493